MIEKAHNVTVGEVLHNLRALGDGYESVISGENFHCRAVDAAVTVKAAALILQLPCWIPVAEQLPPLLQEVLGWHKDDRVRGWFRHSGTTSCGRHWESWTPQDRECDDCSVDEPSHWMPLPPPPTKETV